MSKSIELVCNCGKVFNRPLKEHKRSVKLGRKEYCSLSCFGKDSIYNNLGEYKGNIEKLKGLSGNRRDEFTGFRHMYYQALKRRPNSTITKRDKRTMG